MCRRACLESKQPTEKGGSDEKNESGQICRREGKIEESHVIRINKEIDGTYFAFFLPLWKFLEDLRSTLDIYEASLRY